MSPALRDRQILSKKVFFKKKKKKHGLEQPKMMTWKKASRASKQNVHLEGCDSTLVT